MSSRIAAMPAAAHASSSLPPGAPDTPMRAEQRAARLDHHAAAHRGDARAVADAALRPARLRGLGELGGVGAKARRGVGLGASPCRWYAGRRSGRAAAPAPRPCDRPPQRSPGSRCRGISSSAACAAFSAVSGVSTLTVKVPRPRCAARTTQHRAERRQPPASLLPHEEGEFLVRFGVRQQLVPGLAREGLEVLHRARVGGDHLQHLARRADR